MWRAVARVFHEVLLSADLLDAHKHAAALWSMKRHPAESIVVKSIPNDGAF
jgi:hypothetical protein